MFDGTGLHRDAAVVIEGTDVVAIEARNNLPPGLPVRTLQSGAWLAPDTLVAVGMGKEDLKFADRPFADENRRVQIANSEVKATAAQ